MHGRLLTVETLRVNPQQDLNGLAGTLGDLGCRHSPFEPGRDASISDDGRYVAFSSFAANLVADDTNRCPDVFVRDLVGRATVRINVSSRGEQAESYPGTFSGLPSISGDGRSVTFVSTAANLGDAPATVRVTNVYVRNLDRRTTTYVATESADPNGLNNDLADISADGRYIAVLSDTSDDGHRRLFVRDMMTGGLSEVSVPYDDRQPSPPGGRSTRRRSVPTAAASCSTRTTTGSCPTTLTPRTTSSSARSTGTDSAAEDHAPARQ